MLAAQDAVNTSFGTNSTATMRIDCTKEYIYQTPAAPPGLTLT